MPNSLQDQLKKSGLIDDKKAKQLKRAKNKQEKLARKTKSSEADQSKLELKRAKAEQIARDRQLNLERNEQAEKRALTAQIKQLIAMNTVDRGGDRKFSFSDAGVIKHIYVSQTQIDQLSRGTLAIVRQFIPQKDGHKYTHQLVPMGVAEKIEQRDPSVVVFRVQDTEKREADDPYADFQIPDDLTW